MTKSSNERLDPSSGSAGPRLEVRLPGFVSDQQIGLGDVVRRVTYAVGIRPCGGCQRRVDALNRLVALRR